MKYPAIHRNGINYGNLVTVEFGGQIGYMEQWRAEHLGLAIKGAGTGDFREALCLDVEFGPSQISVHFPQGSDIELFAKAITASGRVRAKVVASARILATYAHGELVGQKRKLSHFYTGISEGEDAAVAF